ncbi:hypothetical protein SPDO_06640 [Sphingomonas dokdonensis]|uniref:Heme oxygenase n=2 Tax=Sphingomonas dokdonensis TaxID=344880 RepID=A0A245ZVK1_9SPHN|nr:hypothetical protein SPDO_06640 [Sphingomonas dokdonensis]
MNDLTNRADYLRFLQAHARALPDAEAMAAAVWPTLRRRTPLLAADLHALGETVDLSVKTDSEAGPRQWGALYVVEGSRLGGGFLSKRVASGLPVSYLSAVHLSGEWRSIRLAIEQAADGHDPDWQEQMVAGALDVFSLYRSAADEPLTT